MDAEPLGLTIRLVRSYDASLGKLITRMGRVCECGGFYGGIQIQPAPPPEPEYCSECGHEL